MITIGSKSSENRGSLRRNHSSGKDRSIRNTLQVYAAVVAALVLSSTVSTHAAVSPNSNEPLTTTTKSAKEKCISEVLGGNSLKIELIVTCGDKSAIFTYSMLERVYCDAKMKCSSVLRPLVAKHFQTQFRLTTN